MRIRSRILRWAMVGACAWSTAPIALAWGPEGHQLVGAIADTLIAGTPAATQVASILGSETLQTASLWADCAKGTAEKPPYAFKVDTQHFPECAPFESAAGQAKMVAYVKRNLSTCQPGPDQESCHRQYHYADVAIQRDHYGTGEIGTSDHDVVAAIRATLAVLKDQPSPAPFDIRTKKEALRLLVHFVGDIHQPLHVAAIYLNPDGVAVDPDQGTFDPGTATRGGNLLFEYCENLHHSWDAIPTELSIAHFKTEAVTLAQAVTATPGVLEDWPVAWASESVQASHAAFTGLNFGVEDRPGPSSRRWGYLAPRDYAASRAALQRQQLVKAGARLAQLLEAVWP